MTAPARSEGPRQRKGSTLERGSFKYVLFLVAGGLIVAGFYIAPVRLTHSLTHYSSSAFSQLTGTRGYMSSQEYCKC